MDLLELKSQLESVFHKIGNVTQSVKPGSKFYELRQAIIQHTSFLPLDTLVKFRAAYIIQGLNEPKLCRCGCGQVVKDPNNNYVGAHANRGAEVKEKKRQVFLAKYGVENASQMQEVKDKKTETFQEKYGGTCPFNSKSIQEQIAKKNLERYGSENVFGSKEIQEKIKKTNIERYGTNCPLKNSKIMEKKNQTNIERYGSPTPLQNPEVLEKMKQTNLERHGVPFMLCKKDLNRVPNDPDGKQKKIMESRRRSTYAKLLALPTVEPSFTLDEFLAHGSTYTYKWKCRTCNTVFDHFYIYPWLWHPTCPKCSPISRFQDEIFEFVKLLEPTVENNNRKAIRPLELDIFEPNKRIAIECNGLHWHSELAGTNRLYHLEKTRICTDAKIRLIHVFEDEWYEKKNVVKSRLRYLFKKIKRSVYARNCEIREIENNVKDKFVNKYHIQKGDVCSVRLGAFYKNRLVAVMTFSKLRKSLGSSHIEGFYELSRFCTLSNFVIVGIANKMLSYFENHYSPKTVITYADRRWSEGKLYYSLGFNLDHISRPNPWYVKNKQRYHRFGFKKSDLKDRLEKFDEKLSEWDNMKANGWNRIWDCGNLVFKKTY